MPVLQGNTSGSITGVPYDIPAKIKFFSLVNKTAGDITVTASIVEQGTNNLINIVPNALTLGVNQAYISNDEIILKSGFVFYLVVSGSTDYYITIE